MIIGSEASVDNNSPYQSSMLVDPTAINGLKVWLGATISNLFNCSSRYPLILNPG